MVIYATGGTDAYLETCGCAEGQFGGIARRGYQLALQRTVGSIELLLDAGGFIHGSNRFERLVTKTHMKVMARTGTFAANITGSEFNYGLEGLRQFGKGPQPRFVSTNLRAPDAPWQDAYQVRIKKKTVLMIGVCDPAEVENVPIEGLEAYDPIVAVKNRLSNLNPDYLILLSGLDGEANRAMAEAVPEIDLIIQRDEGREQVVVGSTVIASCVTQGKALIEVVSALDVEEGPNAAVRRIMLGDSVKKIGWAKDMLWKFYQAVREDEELQKDAPEPFLFPKKLEKKRQGYVGSKSCKVCHEREYEDHSRTLHAVAYDALLRKNKSFQPNCVQCHVVGFGSLGGFRDLRTTPDKVGVGCESCHGPGRAHVNQPRKDNIEGVVTLDHCRKCHYGNNDPHFEEHAMEKMAKVNHTRPIPGQGEKALGDLIMRELASRPKPDGPVRLDLFWMSYCPYGAKAIRALIPFAREMPTAVDLRFHYIGKARALEGEAVLYKPQEGSAGAGDSCNAVYDFAPDAAFTALHGEEEVEENMRQVVIRDKWPEKHFDYVELRAQDVHDRNWQAAVKKAGIDLAELEAAIEEAGHDLMLENLRTCHLLNVQSSPSLYIEGRLYRGPIDRIDLARAICGIE
ncbi:MAG: multiheme c-type cytochrome, partial [Verrucomicrobiota bacterium]